jgi:hypothetical protein
MKHGGLVGGVTLQAGSLISRMVAGRELIKIVIARGLNGICVFF